MSKVIYHPEAKLELRVALAWYTARNPTASRKLANKLKQIEKTITVHPDRYPWYEPPFREAGVIRYPYSVIYRAVTNGDILVLAIAHTSREPGYWQHRVNNGYLTNGIHT